MPTTNTSQTVEKTLDVYLGLGSGKAPAASVLSDLMQGKFEWNLNDAELDERFLNSAKWLETANLTNLSVISSQTRTKGKCAKDKKRNRANSQLQSRVSVAVTKCLHANRQQLQELSLRCIKFSLWDQLGKALKKAKKLERLSITRCQMQDADLQFVCEGLSQIPLRWLEISHNKISDGGIPSLCSLISSQSALRSSREFAASLRNWERSPAPAARSLEVLGLEHNLLTCAGADLLAKALSRDSYVKVVVLAGNDIRLKGAKSLVEMIVLNDGLEYIDIMHQKRPLAENRLLAGISVLQVPQVKHRIKFSSMSIKPFKRKGKKQSSEPEEAPVKAKKPSKLQRKHKQLQKKHKKLLSTLSNLQKHIEKQTEAADKAEERIATLLQIVDKQKALLEKPMVNTIISSEF